MKPKVTDDPSIAPNPDTQDTVVGVVSLVLLALLGVVAYPMLDTGSDQADDTHGAPTMNQEWSVKQVDERQHASLFTGARTHQSGPDKPSAHETLQSSRKVPATITLPPITYERLTDSTIVSDFPVNAGESYQDAGRRLVEYGKELCLSYADVAILSVFDAESGKKLGRIDLPLKSFRDFHSGDATDQIIAARMWRVNAPMYVERAFEVE